MGNTGKEKNKSRYTEKENVLPDTKIIIDDKTLKITIPVIPYEQ